MRHLRAGRKLNRTASHRKATLASLCSSLILHKRIRTTVAKAKESRMFVEKLVTRAKNAVLKENGSGKKNVPARREVFSFLRNRTAVTELFKEIAPKVASRLGGYTRVIKLGRRHGDGAELAILEFVDFNVGQDKAAARSAKKSTKRKKQPSKKIPPAEPLDGKNVEPKAVRSEEATDAASTNEVASSKTIKGS